MTLSQFNNLNLKNQIDSVKGKWFYENIKKRLVVRQNLVMFDNDFGFQITYHDGDEDMEGFAILKMYVNDEFNENLGYYDYDKYSDNPNDLLEDICVYISNHI